MCKEDYKVPCKNCEFVLDIFGNKIKINSTVLCYHPHWSREGKKLGFKKGKVVKFTKTGVTVIYSTTTNPKTLKNYPFHKVVAYTVEAVQEW